MKPSRRILSAFLALMMLITMVSPAFAEGEASVKTYNVNIGDQWSNFTIVYSNQSSRTTNGVQLSLGAVAAGKSVGEVFEISDITGISSTKGGNFQGWTVMGVYEGSNPPDFIAQNLSTKALLEYPMPMDGSWVTICFDPVFGSGQGGGQGDGRAIYVGNTSTSLTVIYADDSTERVENDQLKFSGIAVGGTLGETFGVKGFSDVVNANGSFQNRWDVVVGTPDGPLFLATGLTTEQVLAYPFPDGYGSITFEPAFGGGAEPQPPTVDGEEGVRVYVDAVGCGIDVTLDYDLQDPDSELVYGSDKELYFLGLLQNGTSLAENGVLGISVYFEEDPNRKLLGWNVVEGSTGGVRDYAELITTDELLKFEIPADMPAHPNYSLSIMPVWDKDISYYRATVTYMTYGSYIRYTDRAVYIGTVGGGYIQRGESLEDAVLYADPWRENDTFLGWRRVINILSFDKKGQYQGSSYDTSDKNLYTMNDIKGHLAPKEPYHNVYYVAVWQSDVDAGNDPLQHFGSGGATGVTSAHRAAIFFAGEGTLERIEKYSDGYTKTIRFDYFNFFNVRKGVSIGQAFEGTGETNMSYGINIHRDGYNFTGWNVYSIDERTLVSVPDSVSIYDDEALAAVGPYRLDMGPDESREGYTLYQGYTKYTLMYEKLSHEAVFAISVTGNWFAVPTWELSEKIEVEIPGLDEPGYEYYVSIQEDVQLPINVDEDRYGDVGKVKDSLINQMEHWAEKRASKLDGSKIVEIKLLAKNPAGEWEEVRNLPSGGVEITIPYPDKNKDSSGNHNGWQNGKYVVFHFVSATGEVEELSCTNTPQGLKVRVTSFSPFAVARVEETTTPSESGAGRQNPSTGV